MDHPSAERIPILYKRYGKAWQKFREQSEFVEKIWLQSFMKLIKPEGSILDLGCGAGKPIAEYLLHQGFSITGVDSSKPLIKLAKKAFPKAIWEWEDMRTFQTDETFDAVIAWDSFFHLTRDDQRKMFAKFAEFTHKDAPLLFTTGHCNGEAIGDFNGYELYHSSLDPEEYRALLIKHGFGLINYRLEDESCGGRSIWLAKKR